MGVLRNDLGLYDRIGDDWWDREGQARGLHAMNGPRFEHWDEVVGRFAGKRCIDLGCGGGLVAAELLRRGASVIGIDQSAPSLRAAMADARSSGAVGYVRGDVRRVPLHVASADIVLCCDILEHFDGSGRRALLAEAARLLRAGGVLLYDTINRTLMARLVVVHLFEGIGLVPRGTHDPALFVTPAEVDRDCRGVGLEPLSRSGFIFAGLPGMAPHHLTRWLGIAYVGSARRA